MIGHPLWSYEAQRIFVAYGFRSPLPELEAAGPVPIEDVFTLDDLGGPQQAGREILDGVWRRRVLPISLGSERDGRQIRLHRVVSATRGSKRRRRMGAARVKPDFEAASIVMRGSFNPSIFQPAWLAARELISEEDAQHSEIGMIAEQVAVFRVQWLELHVTKDRFQASTSDPSYYPSLGELVRGVFSLLEFTPVHQMGMNRHMHIRVRDQDEWHRLGDLWAPKEAWTGILPGKRPDGLPGVRSLTMEGIREGSAAQLLLVSVAPSDRVAPGIHLSTNEHYEQASEEPVTELMRIIETSWTEAQDYALRVADHLLKESI